MVEFQIDKDGDLEINDGAFCVYIKPAEFAELRDLLDKAIAPAPATGVAARWFLRDGSDLMMRLDGGGVQYVLEQPYAERYRPDITPTPAEVVQWVIKTQPPIQDGDVSFFSTEGSPQCYDRLRERMIAATPVPAAEDGPARIWWREHEGALEVTMNNGDYWQRAYHAESVASMTAIPLAEVRKPIEWLVATQPEATEQDVRAALHGTAVWCYQHFYAKMQTAQIAAMAPAEATPTSDAEPLPFTPDPAEPVMVAYEGIDKDINTGEASRLRGEVSADPAFWSEVKEATSAMLNNIPNDGTARPRMLAVRFTFDPADILAARMVYAALEHLPHEIRKAVEIS